MLAEWIEFLSRRIEETVRISIVRSRSHFRNPFALYEVTASTPTLSIRRKKGGVDVSLPAILFREFTDQALEFTLGSLNGALYWSPPFSNHGQGWAPLLVT